MALGIERVLPAPPAHAVADFVETFAQGLAVMRQPSPDAHRADAVGALWLAIAPVSG